MNWFDVTDLSEWAGHMTGTQRVVYEIASRAYKKKNAKYMVFKANSFVEVDWLEIEKKISKVAEQTAHTPLNGLSKEKRIALMAYSKLPKFIKTRVTPEHKKFVKSTLAELKNLRRNKERGAPVVVTNNQAETISFDSTDKIFVLGKPWDNLDIVNYYKWLQTEKNIEIITLIYDLMPVYMPHLFGKPLPATYGSFLFEACQYSRSFLAISENTKKDLTKYMNEMNFEKKVINVIRLGDISTKEKNIIKPNIDISGDDYILCVGTFEVRKNHQELYYAYKIAEQNGKDFPKLVIVGGKGWYVNDIEYLMKNDPYTSKKFIFPSNITDEQLGWLYENCLYTVYPSVYEGWGLPIAESLARGKAALASNTSSMTEISKLTEYFSPYSADECYVKMSSYLDEKRRIKKECEINKKYKVVTWQDTYCQFLNAVKYS